MWVLSGMAGIVVAYLLNSAVVKRYGERAVIYIVPFIEESSKTVFGYLTSSILASHFMFGIAEAVNDYTKASYKINGRAAVLSILSHSIFGVISYVLVEKVNLFVAILSASLLHLLWNRFMLR
ncbi:hypothetical protein M2349_002573 [Caldanaerobacter subterraneus subsp. tengcongensis MB4]|uniref:PrsW family intramembrane metalloprotease n=1 Tax=Caldanaerobacter subterraneus subsp. tengcongensis (strain DSM 15242 / JCM 11007 / NBRC 100824 / MB4) TaxID=273068 RepID=Q8R758_CALS4|nr:hypothetical protein [Caldanaerobacter subterraneus]AAM25690.1 hypothetical protein TTE2566 [Caldanaerobacter subterraneus subsp. tengcongensis MB4]MBE3578718.1 hypothetical protein [Caldanaerobacter subterraneus]MCS3917432.1 hypothetical protein [Caldanaerobacter subterraneus subsp. tengcongensis MB4]